MRAATNTHVQGADGRAAVAVGDLVVAHGKGRTCRRALFATTHRRTIRRSCRITTTTMAYEEPGPRLRMSVPDDPLVEGHAGPRSRWAASLTTFFDVSRILDVEAQHPELLVDAAGQRLQQ